MNQQLFTIEDRTQVFQALELREAVSHAQAGGIAVHLHKIVFPHSPKCFKDAVKRGEYIAHVFGLDKQELARLGRQMGVRVIYIDKEGTERQHIDMCGAPLRKLLESIK
jgi:hypothetical protein